MPIAIAGTKHYQLAQGSYRETKAQTEYLYWNVLLELAWIELSRAIISEQVSYVEQLIAQLESEVVAGAPTLHLIEWQIEKGKLENSLNELTADLAIRLNQFKSAFGLTNYQDSNEVRGTNSRGAKRLAGDIKKNTIGLAVAPALPSTGEGSSSVGTPLPKNKLPG